MVLRRVNGVLRSSWIELHGIHPGCNRELIEFWGIIAEGPDFIPLHNSFNSHLLLLEKSLHNSALLP